MASIKCAAENRRIMMISGTEYAGDVAERAEDAKDYAHGCVGPLSALSRELCFLCLNEEARLNLLRIEVTAKFEVEHTPATSNFSHIKSCT